MGPQLQLRLGFPEWHLLLQCDEDQDNIDACVVW